MLVEKPAGRHGSAWIAWQHDVITPAGCRKIPGAQDPHEKMVKKHSRHSSLPLHDAA